jgi:hypothetical protein
MGARILAKASLDQVRVKVQSVWGKEKRLPGLPGSLQIEQNEARTRS